MLSERAVAGAPLLPAHMPPLNATEPNLGIRSSLAAPSLAGLSPIITQGARHGRFTGPAHCHHGLAEDERICY